MWSHVLEGPGTASMRLSELTDGLHRGILSLIQFHIFHNRCVNPADWTYATTRNLRHQKRRSHPACSSQDILWVVLGWATAVVLIPLPLIYRHSAIMFSQGQPNSTALRAAMHSSLLSIWRGHRTRVPGPSGSPILIWNIENKRAPSCHFFMPSGRVEMAPRATIP
jgi:hypothetical protein